MRTSPRLLETHGGTERDIVIAIYKAGPGKRTETLEGFEDPTWLRWLAGENGGLFIVADPAASVRMGRSTIHAIFVLSLYATAIVGAAIGPFRVRDVA